MLMTESIIKETGVIVPASKTVFASTEVSQLPYNQS